MRLNSLRTVQENDLGQRVTRVIKSKKGMLIFVTMAALFLLAVNIDLEDDRRDLKENRLLSPDHEHNEEISGDETRDLITDMENFDMEGGCDIGNPTEDANPASADTVKTLLASYPGSGKRFTWTVIKALTNGEVADDWNFSEKLNKQPLIIKTSWPHHEGRWSWDKQMDQVMLLIRNPRWAIPSYHTMRSELDYATDWGSSLLRVPDTYTERPDIAAWEKWRDGRFDDEIDRWADYIDFWLLGGLVKASNKTHARCEDIDIECHPKAIIDFDHFYQEHITAELVKISDVLDSAANVEVIASQARACVLGKVFQRTELHQANRPVSPVTPNQYRFTLPQYDKILNRTVVLVEKFSQNPFALEDTAPDLVFILGEYLEDNYSEYELESKTFLEEWIFNMFGTRKRAGTDECTTIITDSVTSQVCQFMSDWSNHDVFTDKHHPDDFPYEKWLEERVALVQMYYSTSLQSTTWVSSTDHCSWDGVTCGEDWENEIETWHRVTELDFDHTNWSGTYFQDFHKLEKLKLLRTNGNILSGQISGELCGASTTSDLYISADETNCPNILTNPGGCCNEVKLTVPSPYLDRIAISVLGSAVCESLSASDQKVCEFLEHKDNHFVFQHDEAYPDPQNFPYENWLQERIVLAQLYYSTSLFSSYPDWLTDGDHCSWNGVTCDSNTHMVTNLVLPGYGLTGQIPSTLDRLGSLEILDLKNNSFDGIISNDICNIRNGLVSISADAVNCPDLHGNLPRPCCDQMYNNPTSSPTKAPTASPTKSPTASPTKSPTV